MSEFPRTTAIDNRIRIVRTKYYVDEPCDACGSGSADNVIDLIAGSKKIRLCTPCFRLVRSS